MTEAYFIQNLQELSLFAVAGAVSPATIPSSLAFPPPRSETLFGNTSSS